MLIVNVYDRSFHGNPLKHQDSIIQDPLYERPLKRRRHLTPCGHDDNMRGMQRDIGSIKETLEEMASEAIEDRRILLATLEELDIAHIKESLEEITYEAREERDNFYSILTELLAEIQQRD